MILNKNAVFKIIFFCLIIISFFLGYFYRENAGGGGKEFYDLAWPIIQSFKKDFLFTLENYGSFVDYTIPFSHILNAYINPFSYSITSFQFSITIISFIIFIIFSFIFKKIFDKINFLDALLISSTILLLPFFRTSAFWGKNENFGWLFFILALYFFSEIKKDITENPNKKKIFNIIFFCFTSACALYARQALIFLPISYLIYLFFNNANKKIVFTSITFFILFAVPGFLLILFWGGVYPSLPEEIAPHGGVLGGYVKFSHLFKNIPILLSFFGFYLFPMLIIESKEIGYKAFFKKYIKSFLFFLTFLIFLSQINLLDYLRDYTVAGGAVLKLNYLIKNENIFLLLIFSSIGFSILLRFFKEDVKNNFVFLFPLLIIYCFPKYLYQEYVEPLIFIVFFLALRTNLHKIYFKNILTSHLIVILYFSVYLIGSIYFKHFAFDTHEKWIIYLGIK